jgi:hypothetical protein
LKYFAQVIEEIDNGKGHWNYQKIGIFEIIDREENKIGEYIRNYSSFYNTFFAFQHANGNWYALYSPNYTTTRIMELPSCNDIGGEENNANGFCPTDYYVPNYIDYIYTDHEPIRASQIEDEEVGKGNTIDDIKFWNFAFVAGCVWGDDWSDKVEHIDLTNADKGIITRTDKFGYIWIPNGMKLKDAIDMDSYDGQNNDAINITTAFRYWGNNNYNDFDLSDAIQYADIKSDRVYTCKDCNVEEGNPHLEACPKKRYENLFIRYPIVCHRCGKLHPHQFQVPNIMWKKYICYPQKKFILCPNCFNRIRSFVDKKEYPTDYRKCIICGFDKFSILKDQPYSKKCKVCKSKQ